MTTGKNKDILKELKNSKFKAEFLEGIKKLGFPLEFKIRSRLLKERGYKSAQEGFFTVLDNTGQEITKSYDINAYKSQKRVIHKNLTIELDLQLIGDCKFSSDGEKFLFAVPDMSLTQNQMFTGPLLTNFQTARYGTFRNMETVSQFLKEFGDMFISSDVKDTSTDHIISGGHSEDNKIPPYERIFSIVEDTILPAVKQNFIRWRQFTYGDYQRELGSLTRTTPIKEFIDSQENRYYSGRLIIPLIVTSKPILRPLFNKKDELTDIEEIKFTLYEHSVLKPNSYLEILSQTYDIGIFICNEKYFDDFISYVENIFNKIFEEIVMNLNRHPHRLIDDFNEIKKQDTELKQICGRSILPES